jgi:hypothetical protein
MNNAIQFEDRVSRSRSKHEGEPSADVCDRLSRTRASSQRQLPTDHDYAVPTREYQLESIVAITSTVAADSVLEKANAKRKPPQRFEDVDRVTPYQRPGRWDEKVTLRTSARNTCLKVRWQILVDGSKA